MQEKIIISIPVANLYRDPDRNSEVISQVLYGYSVLILEKIKIFYHIQTVEGYQGWIERDQTQVCMTKETKKQIKTVYQAVPLYPTASIKTKPLLILPFEILLNVRAEPEDEERRWIQVDLIEGGQAWVQRGHIVENPSFLSADQMLELSYQFLNLPYIWGGTSSFGYDCSGFIQMLWRQQGILLPRDAYQQIQDSRLQTIEWDKIGKGDLLFYGPDESSIQHVALYLGEQQLIHAAAKPTPILQISNLEESSLKQRYAYRVAKKFP